MAETMDHEIGRTPVTKKLHDLVHEAAAADGINLRSYVRLALIEKLRRDGRVIQAAKTTK